MDRDLQGLRGSTRARGLRLDAAEQFHVRRHVDVQRFDVDAAPHAPHHELVSLRPFRPVHAVLIVDV